MATSKKRSAMKIANDALDEQRPIDTQWLRHLYNSCKNEKERRQWAKDFIETTTTGEESRQLIARAVTWFLILVRQEI